MKMRFALLASFLACLSPAFAANTQFPSQGLEQRIDFWKKVYTQYGKDDVIIHDLFHVNLIYDVANESDSKIKVGLTRNALREIRASLDNLDNLSPAARQIHTLITEQGIAISPALLDELAANVHTQRGIKERFREGIIRSGRYVEDFRSILDREGVPAELALLPLVESSFENVRSRVGAVGIWQFMRSTGRLYLKINSKADERLDPTKATSAAARLLRDNYKALGVWPLAITAYNHGRGGMLRAQKQHGSDITTIINDYEGPVFGYASMNFYSEFLAAVEVYNSYPTYFGELILDSPGAKAPVVQLAKAVTPAPKAAATKAPAPAAQKYKVRNGDTLWEIAQRFGTNIRSLMEKNNLSHSSIYAGQMLRVK
jgi:membrane-bound lytic murein transglycosylase D